MIIMAGCHVLKCKRSAKCCKCGRKRGGWQRALRPVALCLPGLQDMLPVGRIRRCARWRCAYRAYRVCFP
ncbi:hypothetical protein CKO_01940 [Citrobacter koseri ATCC BAA-895]|uniref:Uncharacterized protein n=1 Tax=Citrobacter koseri (strain ATCC BAA-895 / CDC 4225-83 / SGSC4696) TaxID=290338 RepID=A8AHV4_CITK8|nr:hypothetical protein CKO_01940 [Citrobacter koseri ATCC BAA-895]